MAEGSDSERLGTPLDTDHVYPRGVEQFVVEIDVKGASLGLSDRGRNCRRQTHRAILYPSNDPSREEAGECYGRTRG